MNERYDGTSRRRLLQAGVLGAGAIEAPALEQRGAELSQEGRGESDDEADEDDGAGGGECLAAFARVPRRPEAGEDEDGAGGQPGENRQRGAEPQRLEQEL